LTFFTIYAIIQTMRSFEKPVAFSGALIVLLGVSACGPLFDKGLPERSPEESTCMEGGIYSSAQESVGALLEELANSVPNFKKPDSYVTLGWQVNVLLTKGDENNPDGYVLPGEKFEMCVNVNGELVALRVSENRDGQS
jgi:hypothetical protein